MCIDLGSVFLSALRSTCGVSVPLWCVYLDAFCFLGAAFGEAVADFGGGAAARGASDGPPMVGPPMVGPPMVGPPYTAAPGDNGLTPVNFGGGTTSLPGGVGAIGGTPHENGRSVSCKLGCLVAGSPHGGMAMCALFHSGCRARIDSGSVPPMQPGQHFSQSSGQR